MADITIEQVVVEVDITATQNGQSYELQPVLVVNGNGGGSGGGVQSVTGDIVDNTDPLNPIVDTPTIDEVLGSGSTAINKVLTLQDTDGDVFSELTKDTIIFFDFINPYLAKYGLTEMLIQTIDVNQTTGVNFEINGITGVANMQFTNGLKLLVNGDTPIAGQVLKVTNVDGSVEWADNITPAEFISTDANNTAVLGTDDKIFVPATGASTDIEVVLIDTAEYTLLEADIEAFKIFAIQDVVATENVTITIPTTALTGVQFINIRHKGGGNTTIIPSSGVNQVKYESSSEKAITLVSDTANVWELSRGEAIASAYVPPA